MMTFGSNSTRFDVQRSQRLAHHNGPTSRAGSEAPHFGVGIPSNAISHDRLSAIVGGSGLTDNCVRERKTKTLVLSPLRFLLVIREWLGLRDLVQDAGTFPFCRAVV